MIIIGVLQVIGNILGLTVVDYAGRKPLFITSGVISSISMFFMGLSFHINTEDNIIIGFFSLASLILFTIGYSIGIGCLTYLLMGELFPTPQRCLFSSITTTLNLSLLFGLLKMYHPIQMVKCLLI